MLRIRQLASFFPLTQCQMLADWKCMALSVTSQSPLVALLGVLKFQVMLAMVGCRSLATALESKNRAYCQAELRPCGGSIARRFWRCPPSTGAPSRHFQQVASRESLDHVQTVADLGYGASSHLLHQLTLPSFVLVSQGMGMREAQEAVEMERHAEGCAVAHTLTGWDCLAECDPLCGVEGLERAEKWALILFVLKTCLLTSKVFLETAGDSGSSGVHLLVVSEASSAQILLTQIDLILAILVAHLRPPRVALEALLILMLLGLARAVLRRLTLQACLGVRAAARLFELEALLVGLKALPGRGLNEHFPWFKQSTTALGACNTQSCVG